MEYAKRRIISIFKGWIFKNLYASHFIIYSFLYKQKRIKKMELIMHVLFQNIF